MTQPDYQQLHENLEREAAALLYENQLLRQAIDDAKEQLLLADYRIADLLAELAERINAC